MRSAIATIFLGLTLSACGGTSTSPSAPSTLTPVVVTPSNQPGAININMAIAANGSAVRATGGNCPPPVGCRFTLNLTSSEPSFTPIHASVSAGDGSENLEFDIAEAVTTNTWLHVYPVGHYTTTLALSRGARPITSMGISVSVQ